MLIYKITNITNKKAYIGKTVQKLKRRWYDHLSATKRGCNFYFHRAIRKYGKENFVVEPLYMCDSKEELNVLEKQMILIHKTHVSENGYNLTWGGDGICGWHHSEETRRKIGQSNKGKVSWIKGGKQTEESNRKRSISRSKYKTSEETKEKQRQKKVGIKQSDDHIKKRVDGRKNYTHSEETKRKISEAIKGRKLSEETKRKISEVRKGRKNSGMYGKHHSEETKRKMSTVKGGSYKICQKEDIM